MRPQARSRLVQQADSGTVGLEAWLTGMAVSTVSQAMPHRRCASGRRRVCLPIMSSSLSEGSPRRDKGFARSCARCASIAKIMMSGATCPTDHAGKDDVTRLFTVPRGAYSLFLWFRVLEVEFVSVGRKQASIRLSRGLPWKGRGRQDVSDIVFVRNRKSRPRR